MFVHITVSKLYFGWSNPHFLSQLSIELAHSSSSVPHCPFSLHSLSCCVLKPIPTPLSPSPSAGPLLTSPVSQGGGWAQLPLLLPPTLGSFFTPSVSSEQSKTPNSPEGFLSPHLLLFPLSIWALFDLCFSYKTMTMEREGKFFDIG